MGVLSACFPAQAHGCVYTHRERNPGCLQGRARCKPTQREAQFQILWHISCILWQTVLNLGALFNCCFPWRDPTAILFFCRPPAIYVFPAIARRRTLIKRLLQNEGSPSAHLSPLQGDGSGAGQLVSWTGVTQPPYCHTSGKTAHV